MRSVTDVSNQRTPQLIGLAGGPGAGKDTAAGLLVTRYGFHQHAFADALRDFVYATDDAWRLAFDLHGYEQAKWEVEGFRDRLIEVGEAARQWIDPEIWVEALAGRIRHSFHYGYSVVVSDVRYSNESDVIRDIGGIVIAVDRPGHLPESDNAEFVFANADEYVMNHGSIAELWESLDALISDG